MDYGWTDWVDHSGDFASKNRSYEWKQFFKIHFIISEWGGVQNSPTVSDKNWKRDKWCDPLQLTPNVELQINALYFETPSPYAILPTPESVLGLENSMTQNIPLSIGTTTSWSPTITPTQLVNSVKRSIKTKSLTKKQSTLSSRSCHSRTPFDRMQ